MERNRAQSITSTTGLTASGMLVLTVGFQGTAATVDHGPAPLPESRQPTANVEIAGDATADGGTQIAVPVAPTALQPRFSTLKSQARRFLSADAQPPSQPSIIHLENHRRELHRRSNEVESQLLGLQHLLSIQSYGTSFADRLLDEDASYQSKLQQIQLLEAAIHVAIEQTDTAKLSRLQTQLTFTEQELRQLAQQRLQHYIVQAQTTSTLGLWQEPMYRESLRWLMEHTHERHLLNARQQTLARTLIAISPD